MPAWQTQTQRAWQRHTRTDSHHCTLQIHRMKKKKPTIDTNRIDESDPASYRRYKKWRASSDYNDRNREARNAKKRERMAQLRAQQKLDSPIIQAARLAAKEESARRYREKNRETLACKAFIARAEAKKAREEARDAATLLAMRQRNRLDRALWDLEPNEWEQTPSADAQYKGVSGATLKGYYHYPHLLAAWHARCALGEHDHGVDPHDSAHASALSPPSLPSPPVPTSPAPAPSSPPWPVYWIDSRTPSPVPRLPSPIPTSRTDDSPPAYTAIYGKQAPSTTNAGTGDE
ncbi:hypothetical protein B0H12DRAFT_1231865 [Mycena haematopus]|nr:hypothetical protein B0H12DRAFT_1240107 [Mycena haematopus]KAJ7260389.1 hypothetical protein B0H12DRAFT_1231865 [Mycena haematopus]